MNWENVNLKDGYEREQNILDGISFEELLLTIHCNISTQNLSLESIEKQFNESLNSFVNEAKEIFKNNSLNILRYTQNYRAELIAGYKPESHEN